MIKKFRKLLLILAILPIFLISCPPENGENGEDMGSGTISGQVIDYYTKNPLTGVAIRFGSSQATTDNEGNYTIAFSEFNANEDIKQSIDIYKEEFYFYYAEEVEVNTDGNYEWDFSLKPTDLSGYSLRQISGEVFLADAAELPNFRMVTFYIFYQGSYYSISYQYWDDYAIISPVFGDDCLMLAYADPADGTHDPCIFMATGVDLSTDTSVDLTEPASGELDTITLNLDQAGNSAKGMYTTSYGYVPVLARYTYNDGFNDIITVADTINADNNPESIEVYNPLGWQYIWTQYEEDEGFPGDVKEFFATGSFIDSSSQVALPSINQSFGPDESADPTSLSFNSPVLSQNSVTGAGLFVYLFDDDLIDTNMIGMVISAGESVSFPNWLVSLLDNTEIEFHYSVESYNLTEYTIDFLSTRIPGVMPNTQGGIVTEDGAYYIQTLQF